LLLQRLWRFFNEDEQQKAFCGSQHMATEEVCYHTGRAAGIRVAENPCSYEYVRYQIDYSIPQIDMA